MRNSFGTGYIWSKKFMYIGQLNGEGRVHINTRSKKGSYMEVYSNFV